MACLHGIPSGTTATGLPKTQGPAGANEQPYACGHAFSGTLIWEPDALVEAVEPRPEWQPRGIAFAVAALDGVETRPSEVLVGDISRQAKAGLAGDPAGLYA